MGIIGMINNSMSKYQKIIFVSIEQGKVNQSKGCETKEISVIYIPDPTLKTQIVYLSVALLYYHSFENTKHMNKKYRQNQHDHCKIIPKCIYLYLTYEDFMWLSSTALTILAVID